MNPVSEEKLILAGKYANLSSDTRVLDLGCGNGTALFLWNKTFGITGTGIEIRKSSAKKAKELLAGTGIEILADDATEFPDDTYNAVSAIGISFLFDGVEGALHHIAEFEADAIIIGDRFWGRKEVPPEFSREWAEVPTSFEVVETARKLGYRLAGLITATKDEWDVYESAIWQNCVSYIALEKEGALEVAEYLECIQDEYLSFGREYMDWGQFVFLKL